jgi:filamentous hemagglutinin family protein
MAQTTAALPSGTLPVLRSVVAGRANVTSTVPGVAAPRLTVDQASRRAIVDWKSFNIGRSAEVQFKHQQGSSAVTLNRIYDANPSVIQGKLTTVGPTVNNKVTAGGQVILINQNGILFDRGAQVNTQALLASTLNLTMSNSQFCGGDLRQAARDADGGVWMPALAGTKRHAERAEENEIEREDQVAGE